MENTSSRRQPYSLPTNYNFINVIREGCFETIIKCLNRATNEVVAMKISNFNRTREATMMRTLKQHNLDKFNIIRFNRYNRIMNILEFECVDISLKDYITGLTHLMSLKEIQTVVQQLAVALNALKKVNVIHTDVTVDNILLVDRNQKPLRVKLSDFEQAIFRKDVKQGMFIPNLIYKAPENILGLPFTESIDVWSLGHVLAYMLFGTILFPGDHIYETLYYMTDLLGQPPRNLLDAGGLSETFFRRRSDGSWILRDPMEYYSLKISFPENRKYTFRSLEELKTKCHERENQKLDAEWTECIELLKAMLQWDEKDRITPCGILKHPFITKNYCERRQELSLSSEDYDAPQPTPNISDDSKRKDEEIKMLKEQIKKKDEKINKKDEKIKMKDEKIEIKDEEIKMKDEAIMMKNGNLNEKDGKIKTLEEQIRRKDEKINEKDEKIKKLEEQIEKKDEKIRKKDEKINEKDEKIRKLEEQTEKKDEKLKMKDEKINEKDGKIRNLEEQIEKKDEKIKMKDEKINEKDGKIKSLEEQIEKKDEKIKMKHEDIHERDEKIKKLEEQIEAKNEKIKTKDENNMEKDEKIKKLEEQIKKKNKKINMKVKEIKMKDEEIEMKSEKITKLEEQIKEEAMKEKKKNIFERFWSRMKENITCYCCTGYPIE